MNQLLLGVILCGGQSKRMGSDKGLLKKEGKIWAEIMAMKILTFNIPVVYSINKSQQGSYDKFINSQYLIVDNVAAKGPLTGLLSVHQKFPNHNILLLACDMLDMDEATIHSIIQIYLNEPGYDFYVFQDAKFAQPFCGIYTSGGLAFTLEKVYKNEITNFSMQHILSSSHTKRTDINNAGSFTNYNEMKN